MTEEEDRIEVAQIVRQEFFAGRDAGAGLERDRPFRDQLRIGAN